MVDASGRGTGFVRAGMRPRRGRLLLTVVLALAVSALCACSPTDPTSEAGPISASSATSATTVTSPAPAPSPTSPGTTVATSASPATVSEAGCTTLVTSWNSVMTTLGVGPLNPNGWAPASVPGQFPLPADDGHATAAGTCGASDSTGATSVLARYSLDNSGDWDTAYYYAVRFAGWSGPGANSPHVSGSWRSWTFSMTGSSGQAQSAWILASGSTMFVGYSVAPSSDGGGGGGTGGGGGSGATGQITVIATFIGTSSRCSGTDVSISGPDGYSDQDETGSDGTLVIGKLAPGTYEVTGGGGQAANPVVNGAGVAEATVTVTAGGNAEVDFGCS